MKRTGDLFEDLSAELGCIYISDLRLPHLQRNSVSEPHFRTVLGISGFHVAGYAELS